MRPPGAVSWCSRPTPTTRRSPRRACCSTAVSTQDEIPDRVRHRRRGQSLAPARRRTALAHRPGRARAVGRAPARRDDGRARAPRRRAAEHGVSPLPGPGTDPPPAAGRHRHRLQPRGRAERVAADARGHAGLAGSPPRSHRARRPQVRLAVDLLPQEARTFDELAYVVPTALRPTVPACWCASTRPSGHANERPSCATRVRRCCATPLLSHGGGTPERFLRPQQASAAHRVRRAVVGSGLLDSRLAPPTSIAGALPAMLDVLTTDREGTLHHAVRTVPPWRRRVVLPCSTRRCDCSRAARGPASSSTARDGANSRPRRLSRPGANCADQPTPETLGGGDAAAGGPVPVSRVVPEGRAWPPCRGACDSGGGRTAPASPARTGRGPCDSAPSSL